MSKIKKFELLSAIGTIAFGSLLHFAFEWSGKLKPVALIAAVNESTWEHLKLAFWPAFIFAIIGYFIIGRTTTNFFLAQGKKLLIMPILIIGLFYGWLLFFDDNVFYDISIFIVAVLIGHYIAYRLETSQKDWGFKKISLILIAIFFLAFSLLTYFPPKNFLFQDPVSKSYGIITKKDDGLNEALKTEDETVDRLIVAGGGWSSYYPENKFNENEKQNELNKQRVLYYPISQGSEILVDEVLKIKIVSINSGQTVINFPLDDRTLGTDLCFQQYNYSSNYQNIELKESNPVKISSCTLDAGYEYTLTYKKGR